MYSIVKVKGQQWTRQQHSNEKWLTLCDKFEYGMNSEYSIHLQTETNYNIRCTMHINRAEGNKSSALTASAHRYNRNRFH